MALKIVPSFFLLHRLQPLAKGLLHSNEERLRDTLSIVLLKLG